MSLDAFSLHSTSLSQKAVAEVKGDPRATSQLAEKWPELLMSESSCCTKHFEGNVMPTSGCRDSEASSFDRPMEETSSIAMPVIRCLWL